MRRYRAPTISDITPYQGHRAYQRTVDAYLRIVDTELQNLLVAKTFDSYPRSEPVGGDSVNGSQVSGQARIEQGPLVNIGDAGISATLLQ